MYYEELYIMKTEESFADYVGYDLGGFIYNRKYPPNQHLYGNKHHGYATDNQEVFFMMLLFIFMV